MSRLPRSLRSIVADNIRACRKKRFPGRGGAKACAEMYGVSPQQWSPWERGVRLPDEAHLNAIADFFGVPVESLYSPLFPSESTAPTGVTVDGSSRPGPGGATDNPRPVASSHLNEAFRPGSLESFYWLGERLLAAIQTHGVKITIEPRAIAYMYELFSKQKQVEEK